MNQSEPDNTKLEGVFSEATPSDLYPFNVIFGKACIQSHHDWALTSRDSLAGATKYKLVRYRCIICGARTKRRELVGRGGEE